MVQLADVIIDCVNWVKEVLTAVVAQLAVPYKEPVILPLHHDELIALNELVAHNDCVAHSDWLAKILCVAKMLWVAENEVEAKAACVELVAHNDCVALNELVAQTDWLAQCA